MPKSGPFGCFWPPDLRHKELKSRPIFFVWSSNTLEPPVLSPKAQAWPADFELLRRLSELKFYREIPRLKIQTQFFYFLDKPIRWIFMSIFLGYVWKQDFLLFFFQSLLMIIHTFNKYRLTNFINQIEYSLNFLILALKVTRSGHACSKCKSSKCGTELLHLLEKMCNN